MDDITKIDIYSLLEIECNAGTTEIRSAYRKKALKCHPDKNPDDPNAATVFRQLTKALELLLDEKARAAYDRLLKSRIERIKFNRERDSKRQKLINDLEQREKRAKEKEDEEKINTTNEKEMKDEIERLRKEGSKLIEQEMEALRREILKERQSKMREDNNQFTNDQKKISPTIKIKWDKTKIFKEQCIEKVFSQYGKINHIIVLEKKRSALIEFNDIESTSFIDEVNTFFTSITWIKGEPNLPNKIDSRTINLDDFQNTVLNNLRKAEERKRLIANFVNEQKT